MSVRTRLAAPATWLALFIVLTGTPLVAIGWLGWRLLDQERALEARRLEERLDGAAGLVVRELDRNLAVWSELLPRAAQGESILLGPNTTFLLVGDEGVVTHRGFRPAYYPALAAAARSADSRFVDAEAREFRQRDLPGAAAAYRALAASSDRSVRAGALMRWARLDRAADVHGALALYDKLAALGDVTVAGSPAELVATHSRMVLFDKIGDRDAGAREAARLVTALSSGRYDLDRASFDFFRTSCPRGCDLAADPPALAMAAAIDAFWRLWHEQASGRAAWTRGPEAFVAVWRRTPAGTAALVGRADDISGSIASIAPSLRIRVALTDDTGQLAWGHPEAGTPVTREARVTGLPWTIRVTPADPAESARVMASRQRVFVAGFAVMVLGIGTASCVVFRAVRRDLRVAALQSDFVAAVSHEFRTPLAAMCHLTEMLEEGHVEPQRLPRYFESLSRESRRLRAMLENLLDFGRIDAGRRRYALVETGAADIVREVLDECRRHSPSLAARLDWEAPSASSTALCVLADREAIGLALRNLVDNACKYSPESSPVRIRVAAHGTSVTIMVEDEGPGIARHERRAIFRKFSRGTAARLMNVKGTGIGLTMADQIVKGHGGRLELRSEPGRGCRFTVFLPRHHAAGHP